MMPVYSTSRAWELTRTLRASPARLQKGAHLWIDLGDVKNLAVVTVNGKDMGETWHAPYWVDVSRALTPGANQISRGVVNVWVNRLIGDEQPGATNRALTDIRPYSADSPPLRSGLPGPLRVVREETQQDSVAHRLLSPITGLTGWGRPLTQSNQRG